MSSKFEWDANEHPKRIQQEDLVCKDCFHRSGRVDICAVYQDVKPSAVLDGLPCERYRKEKPTP